MQHVGQCKACQAPIYWHMRQLRYTCSCKPGLRDGTSALCENIATIAHNWPAISNDIPQSEITPRRAQRVYGAISLLLRRHASRCSDCDMLCVQGLMCCDYMALQRAKQFWSRHLPSDMEARG